MKIGHLSSLLVSTYRDEKTNLPGQPIKGFLEVLLFLSIQGIKHTCKHKEEEEAEAAQHAVVRLLTTNCCRATQRREPNMSSPLWKFFTVSEEDNRIVICNGMQCSTRAQEVGKSL